MSTPAVAVSHLSKYFPQIELRHLLTGRRAPGVWALKDVAFELEAGEGLCLVGPNGSGKTTLMKLIATLLEPTQGRIFIQGRDALARPLEAKRHLGFITCNEESFYGRLSGWQNLAFFARLQNLDPEAAIPPVATKPPPGALPGSSLLFLFHRHQAPLRHRPGPAAPARYPAAG